MTGVTEGQTKTSCSDTRLLLEKRILEDILSPEERKALEEHLLACPRCRDLEQLTAALPYFAESSTGDELNEGVEAVLDELRHRRLVFQRRIRWAAAVGAAAATVVIALSIWRAPKEPPSVKTASPLCAPSASAELAPGVFMAHCADIKPNFRIDDGAVRIDLTKGAVALFVDPVRPAKKSVTVDTPLGSVRVKGTLFAVRVEQDDTRVDVYRGIVEVIPKDEPAPYEVSAGRGSGLKYRSHFDAAALTDTSLLNALPGSAHVETLLGESFAIVASESSNSGADAEAASQDLLGSGDRASRERHGNADSARHSSASMDVLVQGARTCLLKQDWECAASQYREVLTRYARHPDTAAVLISLAKIELRHLKEPKKALTHYSAYLKTLPNGPLAEEALLGTAEAYRRLGQEARERDTLQIFLDKFPRSTLSEQARARLAKLGGAS